MRAAKLRMRAAASWGLKPLRVDIGDYVAVGVCVCVARLVRNIGGQAFRSGEAGALADQKQRDARTQQFAHLVEDSDPAMMNHEGLADFPMPLPWHPR